MKAKEYLGQIDTLSRKIRQLWREKEALEALLGSGSLAPKEVQVLSCVPADPMGDRVAAIVDKEKEMDRLTDLLIDKRQEILDVIHSLEDPDCVDVLYKRYMEGKLWEDVAEEMHFCKRQVHRIHAKALGLVEEKLEDGARCHTMSH